MAKGLFTPGLERSRPTMRLTIVAAVGLTLSAGTLFPDPAGSAQPGARQAAHRLEMATPQVAHRVEAATPRAAHRVKASEPKAVHRAPSPRGRAAASGPRATVPKEVGAVTGSRADHPEPRPAAAAKPQNPPLPSSRGAGGTKTAPPAPPGPARPAPLETGAPLAPPGRYLVAGYYPVDWAGDRTAFDSVREHGADMDVAIYFGYTPDREGRLHNPYPSDETAFLSLARQQGIKALAAVHNYAGGGFDGALAHRLLTDDGARRRVAGEILRVMEKGYAGVNIDLENVPPADRGAFTAFIEELAARLRPAGYAVTVAVPAKTGDDPRDGWSGAFDYGALGRAADAVMVMAYDEHWLGGDPGPVASIGWVDRVARYAAASIPPRKVLLGIACYGYDWAPGRAAAVSAPRAINRARALGVPLSWDEAAQVPWYRYYDERGAGHVVYFENASSMAAKVDLVERHGLGGIALWRLGFEEAAAWRGVIRGKLR